MTDSSAPASTPLLSITIAAYREAENLAALLPAIQAAAAALTPDYEVLVIDTEQPLDDTPAICAAHGVRHIPRRGGSSYGAATRTAIAEARGTYILNMDADGSHSPEYFAALWAQRERFDITIGSRYAREPLALSIVSSVAVTYFQALEARDRITVAQNNLDNAQTILRGLVLEQSAGIATALDVAQQETAVALLAAAVPPLLQQFRQSVNALALLIGRTPEDLDIDGTLAEVISPEVDAGLPSELLSRRPDVASAEEQLIAANADIRAARAALFPSIQLTANGGFESTALASLVNPRNRVYALTGGATQPIFHGGALLGQYRYTQARYTELLTNYHKTVITALGNVENALIAAQQTALQQSRQADAVAKAGRAYQYSQAQLQAGTVNVITVLNTENALFSAQDALVQVKFSHLQALVDLYNALGGGWRRASSG